MLDDPCEVNLQCRGTKHAGICGEDKLCTCDHGFIRIEVDCLQCIIADFLWHKIIADFL